MWLNFDASPTLRISRVPVLGFLVKGSLNAAFPENVRFGDIVKGLPVKENSCTGVYCSHVLEHLSLNDFRIALKNTFKILLPGGIFRLVMPDLAEMGKSYLEAKKKSEADAAIRFMKNSGLALESRQKGMKAMIESSFGNARHQWLWDYESAEMELKNAGFKDIRRCSFGDCKDEMFQYVEAEDRFRSALAIEARK